MSPEEISSHAKVKRDVQFALGKLLESIDLGELLPDGTLFVNAEADVSNEPDLMFCSWDSLRSGRVSYRENVEGSERLVEVAGAPDMVMEVVSRSSVRKDTQTLRKSYLEAGVKEYWLIDARGRDIDFQLLTRGDDEFRRVESDADGYLASGVFGCSVRLTRGTNPVGGVQYHLDVRDSV
jgi:Uma2 family endonuclease